MVGPNIIAEYQAELGRRVLARRQPPAFDPLPVSPWQAMSLLQKAVRRGRTDLALQAAATLLLNWPDRLWRRCGYIAFEDVGVANLDVVGVVTAALGGKRVRAGLGGEWSVASLIVELMASSPKCRASDDMLMSTERHPSLAEARRLQPELSLPELRRIVLSPAPLLERALALRFICGTDRQPSSYVAARRGEPALAFDLLDELGTPPTMVEVAREGFRKTGVVLAPFVGLLMEDGQPERHATQDDPLPPEALVGSLPCWALDMFVREGRQALTRFLVGESETAEWVRTHVPRDERINFVGNILFFAEGGRMRSRLRWPTGDELLRQAGIESHGPHCPDANEALDLLRSDIPELNRIRSQVMEVAGYDR